MTHSEPLTPTPQVLPLTLANEEYELTIPVNSKSNAFRCREASDVRFAFVTGLVKTSTEPYLTLKSGESFSLPDKASWSGIIYFASSVAGVTIEAIDYVRTG